MTERAALLSLRNVSRSFGGVAAVAGLDFDVAPGEICGLIGPNGAGKSTTFNLIAGELAPTDGRVFFAGRDITGAPSHKVACLGIARMFQAVHLFESMTVGENVMVGADLHYRLGLCAGLFHLGGYRRVECEARERAGNAIALLGLEDIANELAVSLPFGRQRLVAVARALAAEPRMLLLDEPAAGLSASEIQALSAAVRRARVGGLTVFLIEHNVEFVMALCEHVVVMHGGRKIADGPPKAVRASPAVQEAYLGH